MTGRGSAERSAVLECSLILFSIQCAQRLEAPQGSPALSLDSPPRTSARQDRTGTRRQSLTAEGEDTPACGELCLGMGGGLLLVGGAQTVVGSVGDAACLPASNLRSVTPVPVI